MSDEISGHSVVLGAGSWGTALAVLLARNGSDTVLWSWEREHADAMEITRSNEQYLPGIEFPDNIRISSDISSALASAEDIIVVVPSQGFRAVLESISNQPEPVKRVAWATKGFEPGSGKLLNEVCEDVLGTDVSLAVISGPSFAEEVARGLPTAVTVASRDEAFSKGLAEKLHNRTFRVYTTDDIIGVQLGGAMKNVFAIAAGITDGLEFGANARAALISRGLAEMIRLGTAMGGRRETLMGLAGVGDLVLTCTDNLSRNRRLGLALGQGAGLQQALDDIGQAVEGVGTAKELMSIIDKMGVELPIIEQVYHVLFKGRSPLEAAEALLMREQKAETL